MMYNLHLEPVTQPLHPLYGGAMVSHIDSSMKDVSSVRPLPDTQEMFVNPQTGQTLTYNIMVQLQKDLRQSAMTYLTDLTTSNPSLQVSTANYKYTDEDADSITLTCDHNTMYKGKLKQDVFQMHIVRLSKYKTDVIIYCLTPASKPEDQKVF